MNVAILLHGLVHRSLEYTKDSLINCLIQPLSADIFYHSWEMDKINNPRTGESLEIDSSIINNLLPQSKGIIEDQKEFDKTLHFEIKTNDQITLANYMRDLESQSRAFSYFESNKKKKYDLLIVARPDVKYFNVIKLPSKINDSIFVPNFHHWWGINDRFAMGPEDLINKYCNRKNLIFNWIKNGEKKNSEMFLDKFLNINDIDVQFIDFVFQRIRANGEIAEFDKKFYEKRS